MVENVVQQFIEYLYHHYTCIDIIYQAYTPSTVLGTLCSLLQLSSEQLNKIVYIIITVLMIRKLKLWVVL